MTRTEIITTARSYLGTPFHHQGRLKGVGVDCVGLIVCVLRELGVEINDSFDYNGHPDSELLTRKLSEHFNEIPVFDAMTGDLLLFRIGRNPQHLAFISKTYPHSIINTHQSVGKVIEAPIGSWSARIDSAWAIPGVSDG